MIMISITAPGGRSGQIIDIFEITGGAGDIENSTSKYAQIQSHLSSVAVGCAPIGFPMLRSLGFGALHRSRSPIMGLGGRSGQILQFTCSGRGW